MSKLKNDNLFEEEAVDDMDPEVKLFPADAKKSTVSNKALIAVISVMAVIAVLLIVAAGVLYGLKQKQESDRAAAAALAEEARQELEQNRVEMALEQSNEYTAIVERTVMLDGISIEGISVGGMSLSAAKAAVEEKLNIKPLEGSLDLVLNGNHYTFDLSCIHSTNNLDEVLAQANSLLRTGAQDTVLAEAATIKENGKNFSLTYTTDDSGIDAAVAALADTVDVPVENASTGVIDKENHVVTFAPGVNGLSVDREALAAKIRESIHAGSTETPIEIPYTETVASSEVQEPIFTIMETSLKGSSSNRIYNVTKGADIINGTVLKPGEVFSANDTLGIRTTANGWKMAHAYVGGTTDEQAGGGVCQLSSTLYNAAVMADLEIVYRRNHSMFVSYVKRGLDATINSVGNMIDFKMRNNTDSDVVIFSWVSGKTLTMKVYRCPFGTDEWDEIRLDSTKLKTIQPSGEEEIIVDETKEPGYELVEQERRNGELWQSYKIYYKNGVQVKKEKLDTSTYSAFNGRRIVGPEAEETEEPAITESPEVTPKPEETETPAPAETETPAPDTETPAPDTETPAPEN